MLNIFIPVPRITLPIAPVSTTPFPAKTKLTPMHTDNCSEKIHALSHTAKLIILFFIIAAITPGQAASGANYYTRGTGHWSSPTMWATSAGGVPCGCYPSSTDAVFIGNGHTLTADGNHTVASLTFEDNSITGTVNVNAGVTLNITGAIIIRSLTPQHKWALVEGQGTITANSVSVGHNMTPYTSSQSTALYIQGSISFSVAGDVTIYANENYDITNNAAISLRSGTLTVGGTISMHAEAFATATFQAAETGQVQTGTLVLTGSTPWTLSGAGTNKISLNGSSVTTVYQGTSAQTILGTTYNHLTINTPASASIGAATTVDGILRMTQGTLLLNGKTLTYGASASLVYNGLAAQTAGQEWPANFARNITIANNAPGGVSPDENKTVNAPGTLAVTGHLNFGTWYVGGSGAFTLADGGTLASAYISNGEGFGMSGDNTTGSIRVSGTRNLGTGGNFILNGLGAPQETGTNMPATVNSLGINNASGVVLSQNTVVSSLMDFQTGVITTGDNTLTIGPAGIVNNAGNSRYVNGKLARIISTTGSKEFAIGKNGNYRPVTLNFSALAGTSTVVAEQFEAPMPGAPPENAIPWVERYWELTESGSTSCTYKLTLDGTGFIPAHTPRMIKGDGITNTAFNVTSPDYTSTEGFTTFGNFALGEAGIATVTTPHDQVTCIGSTSVDLTATVSPAPDGGMVQFYISGSIYGGPVPVIAGVATISYEPGTSPLPTHTIRADYTGNGDYLASSSDPGHNATLRVVSGIWLGTTSSEWNTPSNWCGGVPTLSTDVVIPAGTPFMPHVTSGLWNPAVCNNLTIQPGAKLTVDAWKIIEVYGTLTNEGEGGE
ncbi:MAG: hypothetical protein NT040_08970 [Bacteroidetes bacterium]|nr:hypothetical protein [Bacteroidota bacterium]